MYYLAEFSFLINLALVYFASKKRHVLLAACFFFQLFLVAGQAIQIQEDLKLDDSLIYLNHEIGKDGFFWSQIYLLIALIGQLLLLVNGKKILSPSKEFILKSINISLFSYSLIFIFTISSSFLLIFFVVGVESVINDTRPGIASGTTIFLVLMSLGLMPSLEKLSRRQNLKKIDILLAVISLITTMLFSRLHVIIYALTYLFCIFYAYDYRISFKPAAALKMAFVPVLTGLIFFGVGAYRDALNYQSGSSQDILDYIRENPDVGVLSLRYNYLLGVEGMSGLSGAFTQAMQNPELLLPNDFGLSTIFMSLMQVTPGFLKVYISTVIDFLRDFYWYQPSIVSSGIEGSFVSFGILGIFLYPLIFLSSCNIIVRRFLSAKSSFDVIFFCFLSGLQVLMVRGSWHIWLAHIIAYYVAIKIYLMLSRIRLGR